MSASLRQPKEGSRELRELKLSGPILSWIDLHQVNIIIQSQNVSDHEKAAITFRVWFILIKDKIQQNIDMKLQILAMATDHYNRWTHQKRSTLSLDLSTFSVLHTSAKSTVTFFLK